ncbi:MAG: hypothetical protein A2017_12100 [Lentisphaerae bacterium GWF2_44_16]|nr:MAG: hypothetical protein A2017_12100 [Lentisphaerae bacterium GWF2_44_16]
MRTKYKTAVIGGTMTGLGAALCRKDDCIVIERGAVPGFEFAHAFKAGKNWDKTPVAERGASLKAELEKRNILENGRVSIAAISPVIFNMIKNEKLNFLFWTEIPEITKKGKYWEIKLFNASGISSILAENILDTSSGGIFGQSASSLKMKRINAVLSGNGEIFAPDDAEIIDCRFPFEKIFSVSLDMNADWPFARKKMFDTFISGHRRMKEWRIAATAFIFDYSSEKGPFAADEKWTCLPSTGYDNALEALEGGYTFEREN